nr:zinc finger, CCHC-type [Tanacetum cinerariifolium]
MLFEEATGRLTAYEEQIKSQDTLEANDQDKLLMASSNNKTYGKWRGKDFNKEGKESIKWKNNPNARRASTSQGSKDKSKLRCYECDKTRRNVCDYGGEYWPKPNPGDKNDNTSNSTSVRELGNVSLQCPKLTETNYITWALMMETILKAYGIWETIVAKDGVATNEKKENTSKAIIFQTMPQDILMQLAQYSTAKEEWDSIKVKNLRADLFQKARLQTLRNELEMLRIKPNEKVSDFEGKLSSIMAKFKGLGETLEDKVLLRNLLNSVLKKFLPIVATIEQYQDLDEMSFEEAIRRLTTYEERIKSQDTLEAND